MSSRREKSERHALLNRHHPSEAPDSWREPSRRWMVCQDGPCKGGRGQCPCPDACEISVRESDIGWLLRIAVLLVALGASVLMLLSTRSPL